MAQTIEQKLLDLVNSFKAQKEAGEKFLLPFLTSKVEKSLKENPGDQTVGALSVVLAKMEENGKLLISRADLQSLYHKHFTFNTRASEVFAEELGLGEKVNPVKFAEKTSEKELDVFRGDEVLVNALESVFDQSAPLKLFSKAMGENALKVVSRALDSWNLAAKNVSVDSGNEKFLIVRADFETPKGLTSFLVPLEVAHGKVGQAEVFIGNGQTEELNRTNVRAYITSHAGEKLQIRGSAVLNLISKAAYQGREVSDAELALTRLNAKKAEMNGEFAGQVVGLSLDPEARPDVQEKKSEEFASFERQFTSDAGQAAFLFGGKTVQNARDSLNRDLIGMGYRPQIRLAKSDESTLYFGVSVDSGKAAFTVPMKIVGGKVMKPSVLIANGSVSSFDRDAIGKLFETKLDVKSAAFSSPLFETNSESLVEEVRKAVFEGNQSRAEDALSVLASRGDEAAYGKALSHFIGSLGKKEASVKEEGQCSMMLQTKTSSTPICGHTGLPVSKVYQDKFGSCRPLHRKGHEDDTSDGGFFSTSKILG